MAYYLCFIYMFLNNLAQVNCSQALDRTWTEKAQMGSTFYKILRIIVTTLVVVCTLFVYVMSVKNFYKQGCTNNKLMILTNGFAINFISGLFVYHLI